MRASSTVAVDAWISAARVDGISSVTAASSVETLGASPHATTKPAINNEQPMRAKYPGANNPV